MRVSADVACPRRRIAGPVVFKSAFLALFSVVILSAPLAAHSQAGAVAARPAVALKGQASTAVPTPATAAPGQVRAARPGGGISQSIKVHGHWVIEVRNPDGSLVRHVEFENSLDPGFSLPIGGTTYHFPGGSDYLAALLNGQATSGGLGTWMIFLAGTSAGLSDLENTTNAPCDPSIPFGYNYHTYLSTTVGACAIFFDTTTTQQVFGCPASSVSASGVITYSGTPPAGTSCNLALGSGTLAAVTTFQYPYNPVQLSGSVVATLSGQVATVATLLQEPCVNRGNGTLAPGMFEVITGNCLLQPYATAPGISPTVVSFTSSTSFPGAPIAVSPGQAINVTVTISFQ